MRVLWILGEVPIPADCGARLRILGLLRQLARRHEVTAAVLHPGDDGGPHLDELRRMCHEVVALPWQGRAGGAKLLAGATANLFSAQPYSVDRYCGPETEDYLAELAAAPFDVIQCENIGFHRYLSAPASAPRVLGTHNVEADIWRQRARLSRRRLLSVCLAYQSRKMARYECRLVRSYDWVTTVSEDDAARMRTEYGAANVTVVPNGVDTDYFAPSGETPEPGLVVFSGAMDYHPNDDAVRYFLEQIWPAVRRRHAQARFLIVGRRPSVSLRALAARSPAVEVTGWIPDVRPYLARASVVVVPLRMGGGSRLKILEAMAMAKPVVATHIGAEGLDLEPSRHLAVADEPAVFAERTAFLLEDPRSGKGLGQAANARVADRYSWAACTVPLEHAWLELRHRLSARPTRSPSR